MRRLAYVGGALLALAVAWLLLRAAPTPQPPEPAPIATPPPELDSGAAVAAIDEPVTPTGAGAQSPTETDAGETIDALFEVIGPDGRVVGTRVTLRRDGGETRSGLTDVMGLARIEVTPGRWRAGCSNDCTDRVVDIVAGFGVYTLGVRRMLPVSGVVVDSSDQPVPDAPVGDCGILSLARSKSDGSFAFLTDSARLVLGAGGPCRLVAPPQRDLRLLVPAYAAVTFTFLGANRGEPIEIESIVAGVRMVTVIERPQSKKPVRMAIGHHEAFVTQLHPKVRWAKASFDVVRGDVNKVEISLGAGHGLIATVTDSTGLAQGRVVVRALYRYSEGDEHLEASHEVLRPDGGIELLRDVDSRDLSGVTDAAGRVELVPNAGEVAPLYELTLPPPWSMAKRVMLRLGEEPVTLVGVPP